MAVWSAAYVNDLPDSAFLLVLPGGKKNAEGHTDSDHRYFPVRNAAGEVDEDHLANALARIPQASTLTPAQRMAAMDKAKALARKTNVSGPKGSYSGDAGSGRSREHIPDEVMGMQTRSYTLQLELRAEGDGRTLLGRAVPYGETATIPGGKERFVMGAFDRQICGRQLHTVGLYDSHSTRIENGYPAGTTLSLQERADGLHGAWGLLKTSQGNDALELVRSGVVTGLSIGFKAVEGGTHIGPDGAYERHKAHLDHVALTMEPAYAGASVTSLRSAHPAAVYRRELERARLVLQRVTAG